jgi:hypothetical protein
MKDGKREMNDKSFPLPLGLWSTGWRGGKRAVRLTHQAVYGFAPTTAARIEAPTSQEGLRVCGPRMERGGSGERPSPNATGPGRTLGWRAMRLHL